MTERRPHWDDDLIDAVRDAVDVEFDDIWKLSEDSIRAVIAAVEDWIDARGSAIDGQEVVAAIAAVARVRELHGRHDPNCPYGEDCAAAGLCLACREEYPCATIRALNRERAGR